MTSKVIKDKTKTKVHAQDFIPSFIRKTYDILEENKFPHLIDWNPDGTALVIKKPSEFSQKVLPVYFKHNNLTSFVRQLNMYNFHKRRSNNLEHVYSHELFQKGKRHLLKEIKRKTHDHPSDKIQKSPESQEARSEDVNSLLNENQFLKRLYNEAMNRVAMLENQAKELATQNQTLWAQMYHRSNSEHNRVVFKPPVAPFETSTRELPQNQLQMVPSKVTLKLNPGYNAPAPITRLFVQNVPAFVKPMNNPVVNNNNNFPGDESMGSTEVSPNSPVLQCRIDGEGGPVGPYDSLAGKMMGPIYPMQPMQQMQPMQPMMQTLQMPRLRNEPQVYHQPQAVKLGTELNVSRQEMSVGQVFETWNTAEYQSEEMICFADQRVDKGNAINMQAVFQDKSMLGKRKFEAENQRGAVGSGDNMMNFQVAEPAMKRHELCIFNKKGIISTGIEDKEIHETGAGGIGAADDIDLMDFNHSFCG